MPKTEKHRKLSKNAAKISFFKVLWTINFESTIDISGKLVSCVAEIASTDQQVHV